MRSVAQERDLNEGVALPRALPFHRSRSPVAVLGAVFGQPLLRRQERPDGPVPRGVDDGVHVADASAVGESDGPQIGARRRAAALLGVDDVGGVELDVSLRWQRQRRARCGAGEGAAGGQQKD